MTAVVSWQPSQLALIKRTVAKDCNDDEFNQFIHICKTVRLDPLRRQIYAFVFGKNEPKYRQMTIVTGIGGYRSIAERTGTYRPDDRAPRYDMGEKNAKTNPLGIARAEVTVYKRAHGEWFPVVGEAFWDEYVPLKDGAIDAKKTGWVKMPRVMIAKCAEANALRKAWPDDFDGIYEESEIDRRMVDITPSESVNEAEAERKLALMGGKDALTVMWDDGAKLERVPEGQFIDRALKWARQPTVTSTEVRIWWNRNEPARAEFKARHGSDYLELQKSIEKLTDDKENAEAKQDAAE